MPSALSRRTQSPGPGLWECAEEDLPVRSHRHAVDGHAVGPADGHVVEAVAAAERAVERAVGIEPGDPIAGREDLAVGQQGDLGEETVVQARHEDVGDAVPPPKDRSSDPSVLKRATVAVRLRCRSPTARRPRVCRRAGGRCRRSSRWSPPRCRPRLRSSYPGRPRRRGWRAPPRRERGERRRGATRPDVRHDGVRSQKS